MNKMRSVLAAAACASLVALPGLASELDELSQMLIGNYQTIFNSGDAAAVANLYAEDAVVLAPNAGRLEGREAIQGLLTVQLEQMGARDIEVEGQEIVEMGSALLSTGLYRMTMAGPEGDMPVSGGWLSVVEEDGNGGWQITRHIWNVDLPQQ
jgi:uncharacterized protein (TIGR02246 family)